MRSFALRAAVVVAASLGSFAESSAQGMAESLAQEVSQNTSGAIGSAVGSDFFRPTLDVQHIAGAVSGIAVGPTNQSMTVLLANGQTSVWSLRTGVEIARVATPGAAIAAPSRDGSVVLAVGRDGSVSVYASTGAVLASEKLGGLPIGAGFLENAQAYAATTTGLVGYDPATGKLAQVALAGPIHAVGPGTDAGEVVVALGSGEVDVVSNGHVVRTAGQAPGRLSAISGCRGSDAIVALTVDGQVERLGPNGPATLRTVPGATSIDRQCSYVARPEAQGALALTSLDAGEMVLRPTLQLGFKRSATQITYVDSGLSRAITAEASGLIRVWDIAQKTDVVQLFVTDTGWAVIDQNGRFDASQEGMLDVGWLAASERLSLAQLSDNYFAPGLLSTSLTGGKDADTRGAVTKGLVLPPELTIKMSGPESASANTPTLVIVVAEDRGGGIGPIRLYHNGKLAPPGALLQEQHATSKTGKAVIAAAFRVTPTAGANTFLATSTTAHGVGTADSQNIEGQSAEVTRLYAGPEGPGKLFVLAVGVNKYKDRALDVLEDAVPDAADVAHVLGVKSGSFSSAVTRVLSQDEATREHLTAALAELSRSNPNDTVVVYLAGHGEVFADDWNFLPVDGGVGGTSLTATALRDALVAIPAQRVLLMIDSCESGQAAITFDQYQMFERRFLSQLGRASGVAVLAGARANQGAAEADVLGHGLFTTALLMGLDDGRTPSRTSVTAHRLIRFVASTMPNLSRKVGLDEVQQPVAFTRGADFVVH